MSQTTWSGVSRQVRDQIRAFVFARAGGRCEIPEPHDCSGRAEDLDHIVPRKQAPHLLLDVSNMRAACAKGNRGRRPRESSASREW